MAHRPAAAALHDLDEHVVEIRDGRFALLQAKQCLDKRRDASGLGLVCSIDADVLDVHAELLNRILDLLCHGYPSFLPSE